MWWNVGFRLNSARHSGYAVLETPNAVDTHILNLVGKLVRERQAAGERPRIEMIGMGGAWQNVAMVRGLEATNGYNPLRNGVYDKLVAPGESNWLSELRDFPVSFDSYNCALSRALGLEFIVLDRPIDKVPHLARRTVPEVIKAGPKAWVYRLQNPMPRLKFTRHVQVADVDAMIGTGKAVERLAADRVLIDDDTPPKASYAVAPAGNAGSAVMTRWRHDRVEIDAASDSGGMLVLHDVYYPGWVAEIDGKRTPILRADVLFRGVEVPPGRHQVVFRFAPLAPDNLWAAFKGLIQRR
jgi:hypothetical protein